MNNDGIDASVGLAFSLILCESYRQNGILRAMVHHVPNVRGHCQASLTLLNGKVASCEVVDQKAQQYTVSKEMLIRLDEERGPFEWTLLPLAVPLASTQSPPQLMKSDVQPEVRTIPKRRIQRLEMRQIHMFSRWQQTSLLAVFTLVDGHRTVEDIQLATRLPALKVEEVLRILISINAIVIE